MNRTLHAALVLVAVGCGQARFTRSNASDVELARDRYVCEVQAQQLAEPHGGETAIGPAIATTIAKRRFFNDCMAAKGWTRE